MRPFEHYFLERSLLRESREVYERAVMGRPIPDLYHYTSAIGLTGILSSRTLWATDCRALNDASELLYAETVVREAVQAEAENAPSICRDFLRKFSGYGQFFAERMRVHVASFCERGDSLSQWREYARTGYSLGFSGASLEDLPDCHIVRVEYSPDIQRRLIRETVAVHMPLLEAVLLTQDINNINTAGSYLASQIAFYIPAFKNPAFEDEREWRAVTGAIPATLKTRTMGDLAQPYIELSLEVTLGMGLPLVGVVHSPFISPTTALPELRCVLAKHGYSPELAASSAIPLRRAIGA